MANIIIKMSTQETAAIILDSRIHKAPHETLVSVAEQISGYPIDLENEPCTREELIGEIRRAVLEARIELGQLDGVALAEDKEIVHAQTAS